MRHWGDWRQVIVEACVGLVALAVASPASAEPALDASCVRNPPFGNTTSLGNSFFAQTFTAQASGRLTTAQPTVYKTGTPGDWIVQINEAQGLNAGPSNVVLASVTIPDSVVPAGAATLTAEFSPPPDVTAGQPYALAVTRPGSSTVGVSTIAANPCPGFLWRRNASESSPWSTAGGPSDPDMPFATFVDSAVPDAQPPDTTITKKPKDKTKKKTATFEFTSSEPGSTFECSLDGKPFAPCTSPDSFKVKKGKHSFEVRAKDPVGNLDGSPASDDWKVKKKKK